MSNLNPLNVNPQTPQPQSQHSPSLPSPPSPITMHIVKPPSDEANINAIECVSFFKVSKTLEESEEEALNRISSDLLFWVKSPYVNPEVKPVRAQAVSALMTWLQSPEKDSTLLTLTWNALPPTIFREKIIQDHLTKLKIECGEENPSIIELNVLKNCLRLESLTITGKGIEYISDSIGDLHQLIHLEITSTNISELPETIGQMVNLKSLDLQKNKKITELPASLVQLSNLESLSLQKCEKLERLPDTDPHRQNHEPYRFSNLKALIDLNLDGCRELCMLPKSICNLSSLKYLRLSACHSLEELPEHIHHLTSLRALSFSDTKITSLPIGLYQFALKNPDLFLPAPYSETVGWMRNALANNPSPYRLEAEANFNRLKIQVKPEAMIPFAKELLKLLITKLRRENRLANPPHHVSVIYEGESAADLGGLRRDFFYHLLPNCAKQMQHEDNPILVNKGDFLLLETSIGLEVLIKNGELDSRMNTNEWSFCKTIGHIIGASFLRLGGGACKLGNVFPEHFYWGLASLALDNVYNEYTSFNQIPLDLQQSLCRLLAIHDKGGLTDVQGQLLFNMECLKEGPNAFEDPNLPFQDDDLYKIWKLINHYEGNEEDAAMMQQKLAEQGFPSSMIRFIIENSEIMTKEDFLAPSDAFPQGMLEAFRQELSTANSRLAIQSTLSRYMFDSYHRQCEPLFAVAMGFNEPFFSISEDVDNNLRQQLCHAAEPGIFLSHAVQGPPFTYEDFASLLSTHRCDVAKLPRTPELEDPPEQPGVREKMEIIREWYLNPDGATDAQRKLLLRCINGTDVIQPDMRLTFGGPKQREVREGGEVRFVPSDLSVFHTCFASVELGNDLMQQDTSTPEGRAALIAAWQEHITLAMPREDEGSAGGFGVL